MKRHYRVTPGNSRDDRQSGPAARTDFKKPEIVKGLGQPQSTAHPATYITADPSRIDPHLVTLYDSDRLAVRQYRRVVVSLMSLSADWPSRRVLITSAKHREGRTSVTLNIAGALAQAKKRVLVVDSDLFRPSMLRLLGLEVEVGLPEALATDIPLSRIVVRVLPFGFSLMATRSRIENSVEILGSPAFRSSLQELESDYDFILFDSPPLLASPDAQLLIGLADKALLVIRPDFTTPAQMATALAMFDKEDVLGVVLNR